MRWGAGKGQAQRRYCNRIGLNTAFATPVKIGGEGGKILYFDDVPYALCEATQHHQMAAVYTNDHTYVFICCRPTRSAVPTSPHAILPFTNKEPQSAPTPTYPRLKTQWRRPSLFFKTHIMRPCLAKQSCKHTHTHITCRMDASTRSQPPATILWAAGALWD